MNRHSQHPYKLPAKYSGVLDRPTYKALRKNVKHCVDEMIKDHGNVSIQPTWFMSVKVGNRMISLSDHDIDAVWSKIASDLGLVDDGTNTNTWTMSGKELPYIDSLRDCAKNR